MKQEDQNFTINPLPNTYLTKADKLFALGTRVQINQLKKTIASDGFLQ